MSSSRKRSATDLRNLINSGFEVTEIDDGTQAYYVEFHGPDDSLYYGGTWTVRVDLLDGYPEKPPLISFETQIFHPNVNSIYGAVCLDVLQQDNWDPVNYDLVKVFEFFLPSLLREPNADSPNNLEAAALLQRSPEAYRKKVREYCMLYAGALPDAEPNAEEEEENVRTFSCCHCGDIFDNKSGLERHNNMVHRKWWNKKKPNKCSVCGNVFETRPDLSEHRC